MRVAVFAYSRAGCAAARRVREALSGECTSLYTLKKFGQPDFLTLERSAYGAEFAAADAMVFIGACGIAVREIAPYVHDKRTDPAVVCIDERAQFAVSLLSGHIGGGNALARRLAAALGAQAVVTTATDVNGRFAVDEWAARHGCSISDMALAKAFAAAIIERSVPLACAFAIRGELPPGVYSGHSGEIGAYIGYDTREPFEKTLRLVPRVLRLGIGCRRGTPREAIEAAVYAVFAENLLDLNAVSGVYSIDLKRDEQGLLEVCRAHGWPLGFYTAGELMAAQGDFTPSDFVRSVTGVDNVCERAAMLGSEKLIVRKTVRGGVTAAVALEHWEASFG